MKINSENAKRQRMIARRMKSGKPLVGLLAGIAVGATISGCKNPEWKKVTISGQEVACPEDHPADTRVVKEADERGARDAEKP